MALQGQLAALDAADPQDLDAVLAAGAAVEEALRARLRELSGE